MLTVLSTLRTEALALLTCPYRRTDTWPAKARFVIKSLLAHCDALEQERDALEQENARLRRELAEARDLYEANHG
jgi:hypothetical protein